MGAGRSIAVQNFNEQACILGLGAFYTGMTRFGLSAFASIAVFGILVAGTMWLIRRWHRSNLRPPSRRGRAPARDRPPRQALSAALPERASRRAAWALVFNAFVWGTSWWPLRRLQEAGLHPLWATTIIFTVASLAIAIVAAARLRPGGDARRRSGSSSPPPASPTPSFNWAIVIGDVVRVVLLFYLMPLWTVLLARAVLGERLTKAAALRIGLGAIGAAIVLWPPAGAIRRRAASPTCCRCRARSPTGSASSAASRSRFNNVMLRREANRPEEGRSLAMFLGGAVVAAALAAFLTTTGAAAAPPAPAWPWLALTGALTLVFLAGNLCAAIRRGATAGESDRRRHAHRGGVRVAARRLRSAAARSPARLAVGGAFIVAGAVLAAREPGH